MAGRDKPAAAKVEAEEHLAARAGAARRQAEMQVIRAAGLAGEVRPAAACKAATARSGPGAAGGTRQPLTPATAEGVYGTADVVRIDRGPLANWERASRQVDVQETASAADMPVSVRYYYLDAQRMTPEKLAQRGVNANDQDVSISGLYRESQPFAALAPENSTTTDVVGPSKNAKVELLAPEVVGFELHYYDGEQLVDEWDTLQAGGLPLGVEIRLTLVEPQFQTEPNADREAQRREGRYNKNELVEYRRFVRLPRVDPSPPAQPLLPGAGGNQGGNQNGPGQNGGQQGGQPGQPGQPGSSNAQPQNNQ